MQCPTCGATLPDDARFCGGCGTDLAPPAPLVPSAAQWSPTAPPQPYPVAQMPPAGYPPSPGQPVFGTQPPAPRANTALIVGIAAGAAVLLIAGGLAAAFIVLPAMNPAQPPKSVTSARPSTVATSTPTQTAPPATQPETTAIEPPPATPALSEDTASELVLDYLSKAQAGDAADAKALVTAKYLSRITSDYYKLAAKDLRQYELAKVEQGQGGLMVFVKESWDSGVWTNWYLVLLKDGRLVIDDTGTE